MGEAVLDERVMHTIEQQSGDSLTAVVQLDHVGDLLHSEMYQKAAYKLADYVSGVVKNKMSASFDKSLNWFERNIHTRASKTAQFAQRADMAGKATSLGVTLAAQAMPFIVQSISSGANKSNFTNFFIRWMSYINQGQEITPLMVSNARDILLASNTMLSRQQITEKLQAGMDNNHLLPHLNKKNMTAINSTGVDNMESMAKMVIATTDLKNVQAHERSLEFLEEGFLIPHLEAEAKLSDIMCAQGHLTDYVNFAAFDYVSFFQKFCQSADEALRIGSYDASMDVYAQSRAANQEKVKNTAKTVAAVGIKAAAGAATGNMGLVASAGADATKALAGTLGKDVLQFSEDMMSSTLNPNNDPSTGRDIMRTTIAQRKEFDIRPEEDDE